MNEHKHIDVAIIFALGPEARGLRERGAFAPSVRQPFSVMEGELAGRKVVMVRSGLGKVRAAACTQWTIDRFSPSLVINAGMTGAVCPRFGVGDVAAIGCAIEYDFASNVESVPLWSPTDREAALVAASGLPVAMLGSADRNVDSAEKRDVLHRRGVQMADWEGTAIARTARQNGCPVVLVKAVSDGAGEDCEAEYKANVARSSAALADAVIRLLSLDFPASRP